MSLEAWGDDDAREVPDGWWTDDEVQIVQACIRELMAEPLYEDGQMAKGVSTRFLARLTILQGEAGLMDTNDPLYKEAEAMLFPASYPLGWKLVPIEPTKEMLDAEAAYWAKDGSMYNGGVYKAMLAAAPELNTAINKDK